MHKEKEANGNPSTKFCLRKVQQLVWFTQTTADFKRAVASLDYNRRN